MSIVIRVGYRGGYEVIMTVYSKDEQFLTSTVVCHGDWDMVCRFVDSYPHSGDFKWDFSVLVRLTHCGQTTVFPTLSNALSGMPSHKNIVLG